MSDERPDDPWREGGKDHPNDQGSNDGRSEWARRDDVARLEKRLDEREDERTLMARWAREVTAEQRRARRWKIFFRLVLLVIVVSLIGLGYKAMTRVGSDVSVGAAKPHVAVVSLDGVIDSKGRASADTIIEGLQEAARDDRAKALILRINSPGGSPVQSQRIYQEITRIKGQIDAPVIAVIEDIGASGAYYVAAAADEIYAAPASLVGSIGVIYSGFGLKDAIQKLGVERRVFTAGENKDFLDPFQDVTPEQRAFWQRILTLTHQQFINDVKVGRGDRLKNEPELFSGLVWTGEQAVELGLTDGVDTFDHLIRGRFETDETKDYTPEPDPFERLSRKLGQVAAEWLGVGVDSGTSPVRYELP
ncbi:signal peptide peptidase SppA [Larsenimonas salina]|uniref:signal peptide peptidase SppA n=1 Tax=Larsenimonas salina TaxID=1295565 RepID=UPI0020747D3D|nr:signal peptide peptidase SppA [Larsenimonas salina]MCM5703221.1 signal peptide peptidase SppA [Larsenimonas salina]